RLRAAAWRSRDRCTSATSTVSCNPAGIRMDGLFVPSSPQFASTLSFARCAGSVALLADPRLTPWAEFLRRLGGYSCRSLTTACRLLSLHSCRLLTTDCRLPATDY